MSISLISCIDLNNSIGNRGSLLTKPPLDFQHFKELTVGNYCVFGRKTFEEIGKPLSHRHNIILSSKDKSHFPSGVHVYSNAKEILHEYENYAEKGIKLLICGGVRVYSEFLPFADSIFLTIVDHKFPESDTKFPVFSLDEWGVATNVKNEKDDAYPYDYYFIEYKRKVNAK